ncbi:ABC transporter permease [candidate division KSB1 bacterium]
MKVKKPPRFAHILLSLIARSSNKPYILGDLEENFMTLAGKKGIFFAKLWYFTQVIISLPGFIFNTFYWSFIMLKNYLKTALVNMKRRKIITFINVSGLAIGLAVCFLLIQYIAYEFSYDTFNKNADNIYRLRMADWAGSQGPAGPAAKEQFPEVLEYVRINPIFANGVYSYNENKFKEDRVFYANSSILSVFSFEMLKGDPAASLDEPNTVVLTESAARKYFGNDDPIGRTITRNGIQNYKITGIVQDIPDNSHMKFDILVSVSTIKGEWINEWYYSSFHTYLLLRPDTNIPAFEQKLTD